MRISSYYCRRRNKLFKEIIIKLVINIKRSFLDGVLLVRGDYATSDEFVSADSSKNKNKLVAIYEELESSANVHTVLFFPKDREGEKFIAEREVCKGAIIIDFARMFTFFLYARLIVI